MIVFICIAKSSAWWAVNGSGRYCVGIDRACDLVSVGWNWGAVWCLLWPPSVLQTTSQTTVIQKDELSHWVLIFWPRTSLIGLHHRTMRPYWMSFCVFFYGSLDLSGFLSLRSRDCFSVSWIGPSYVLLLSTIGLRASFSCVIDKYLVQ